MCVFRAFKGFPKCRWFQIQALAWSIGGCFVNGFLAIVLVVSVKIIELQSFRCSGKL